VPDILLCSGVLSLLFLSGMIIGGTAESILLRFSDDFDLNRRMAAGLMRAQRLHEAIPDLEHAVELRPDDEGARQALAAALARIQDQGSPPGSGWAELIQSALGLRFLPSFPGGRRRARKPTRARAAVTV
jgi:hypothetical protein